ncbi:MAG: hypothetical protein M1514_01455 [Patescibacteria group bacterium]|nr:hypothetical protein [Patescibacteria group bacterium]
MKTKITLIPIAFLGLFFLLSKPAMAISTKSCSLNNSSKSLVACYESGVHAIPGKNEIYQGFDKVQKLNCGIFLQTFCGASPSQGNSGILSLWIPTKAETCPNNGVIVKNGYPSWGDYLSPNTNYCVFNRNFYCLPQMFKCPKD